MRRACPGCIHFKIMGQGTESMRNKKSAFYYSLMAALAYASGAYAAGIRVGNLSRSNAQGYQQVNDMRYNAIANTMAAQVAAEPAQPAELPIHVANPDIAEQVRSANAESPVSMAQLERCSMIYPDGKFEWATPTAGRAAGGASTCTSVIEMRAFQAGPNGEDLVLARINLPAGESIRCNISDFPEHSYLEAAEKVEFPADHEPTMEDVIKVMDQEQKQDAGLKIVAGALIGGVGGNFVGKNEPGKTGMFGGGEHKTKSTIVGALGGAALMVGHTQTGKVAGDTILSAGVNATAGAVVGNMVASGDAVLRIEDCIVDGRKTTCLWGIAAKGTNFTGRGENGTGDESAGGVIKAGFYNIHTEDTYVCDIKKNETGENETGKEEFTNCIPRELISISLGCEGDKTLEILQKERFSGVCTDNRYELAIGEGADMSKGRYMRKAMADSYTDTTFIKIQSARVADKKEPAMIADVKDSAFGYKRTDWGEVKKNLSADKLYLRNNKNEGFRLENMEYELDDFHPIYRNAEDGNLIDFGNKARLKSTLTGAGVGGVMGAFSGYQGAKQDIDERWVTAVREYKDSLAKVYCATGTRFLSQYNDVATIPALIMPEQ